MHDPIKYLQSKGFDLQYPTKAVETLKEQTSLWKYSSNFQLATLECLGERSFSFDVESLSFFENRYLYFYTVQNLLIEHKNQTIPDHQSLLIHSLAQAKSFCVQFKTALDEEGRDMGIIQDERTRTGTKTELAVTIFNEVLELHKIDSDELRTTVIQRFQDELNMERSGALTYFHATKKKLTN